MNNEKIRFGIYVLNIFKNGDHTHFTVTKNNLCVYNVKSKNEVRMYWKFVHACELAKQIKDKPLIKLTPLIDQIN